MNDFRLAITKVFKGVAKSFYRFPASITSAIIVSIVALVRIWMDWELQQAYSFLFNSIQLSFILGAIFSMAAVILEETRPNKTNSFFTPANIAGILVAIVSFLLLYFFGGKVAENGETYWPVVI